MSSEIQNVQCAMVREHLLARPSPNPREQEQLDSALLEHAAECVECYEFLEKIVPDEPKPVLPTATSSFARRLRETMPTLSDLEVYLIAGFAEDSEVDADECLEPRRWHTIDERYEIKEVLGHDGMSVVYKAYDSNRKGFVAIKTMKDVADSAALELFAQERRTLANISHPNIVDVLDLGEFEEENQRKPYFVMPLLPGTTLDKLIGDTRHRMTVERTVEILVQTCRGLQAAHARGLIHRDLKPSSLFVMNDDSVKIIDFGVAHLAARKSTTGIKGTLPYVAPEQLQMKDVTAATDIYSLGVVSYEALTGRKPFDGGTDAETSEAIRNDFPPPASDLNSAVNKGLAQVVAKAMAKRPRNRFESALQFGEHLRRAFKGEPIKLFDPAAIQPRIERVRQALGECDFEFANEILNELQLEGHVNSEIADLLERSAVLAERYPKGHEVSDLVSDLRRRVGSEGSRKPVRVEKPHSGSSGLIRSEDEIAEADGLMGPRTIKGLDRLSPTFTHHGARDIKECLEFAKKNDAKQLDLRFTDIPSLQHHISYPIKHLEESSFEEGFGMDGSSIRGWAAINESDMLLIPDPKTAIMDPFAEIPTLVMLGDVIDPITKQHYERDPRWIAQKAELHLQNSGVGDVAYFGAEAEFFIFDNVRFDQNQHSGFYFIDAEEGRWNSGRERDNLGYRPRYKEGYFPVPPTDHYQDMRSEMVQTMIKCGLDIECHHHEVATGGQCEIDQKFDTLVKSADNMMTYKYVIRNVANQYGKTVTFMPKPLFQDNGSGMHTHQSIWKGGKPLFAGDLYAGLSQLALWYIGGLLKHARALSAIIAPTTNSYKRLVPGYEAPVNLAYSRRNRSAACRIPMYSASPKAKRVEFRPPDPAANPYLAFAAMLMAGLDGVANKIEPGEPLDRDIYDLSPEEMKNVPSMPASLDEALNCLEDDHGFLMKGDVFSEELIETFIDYKRKNEADAVRLRPHPYEFAMYYDL